MQVSYYPGCALHGTAQDFDLSLRSICQTVGIELVELPDWNCCGASSAHALSDALSILLPARNLAIAEQSASRELLVPCAACYNRLKVAHRRYGEEAAFKEEVPYNGTVVIKHVNEFFAQHEVLSRIKARLKKTVQELNVVPYYGCLTVRHPKVINNPRPEDPREMDVILEALGARLMPWSYKTECCGGSLMMARTDIVRKLTGDLFAAALDAGADAIVTDCPLCQGNLDMRQHEVAQAGGVSFYLPVFYITEIIGLAIGAPGAETWWKKHLVDPRTLLKEKNLWHR